MICEACQKPLVIGEWPFCPHGKPSYQMFDDELPNGPYVCETLGHEGVYVTSKSHLRREAEARGLVNVVRHDERYYQQHRKQHDEYLRDTGQK